MAATMEKTRHPGIYRRGSRYVVVWRHRGRQHKSFHRTLAEARAAQGARRAGDRAPEARITFEAYAAEWLETYRGRTNRGLGDLTRQDYRRSIDQHAVPFFRGMRLAEIDPPDVRRFIAELEREGNAPSSVRKRIAPLRALFATALEDGTIRTNPTAGVRVTGRTGEQPEEDRRALTRLELSTLLGELPQDWRLFFELLAHSGLRISEAIGLTWADVELGERPRFVSVVSSAWASGAR